MANKTISRQSFGKRLRARRKTAKRGPDKPRTAYDAAKCAGVIGCEHGGPKDLSTNRKYFEGFGEDTELL